MCRRVGKKLPFAGYSMVLPPLGGRSKLFDIVWARLATHAPRSVASVVRPQAPSFTFPVVIGERSHPFPFRTRKLSSLPPMVLRGKLRGRVGHCRDYSVEARRLNSGDGLFVELPTSKACFQAQPSAGTAGTSAKRER